MSGRPSRDDRFGPEGHDEWARSRYKRDRDRILYTRELRRLKDVTQVARAGESYLYHDRLSHSLKVAQLGGALANLIRKRPKNQELDLEAILDPDVVEAACLAHDLGHPPFGHLAETALDEKLIHKTTLSDEHDNGDSELREWVNSDEECRDEDPDPNDLPVYGYEGNAQSFRIVTKLAAHHKSDHGLNLTHATLNGILKYPHSREVDDDKWGYYPSESKQFDWARKGVSEGLTVEAQIMDYADDVTYGIHDVVDFYKGGLLPLGILLGEAKRREDARERQIRHEKLAIANEESRKVEDVAETEVEIDKEELPGKPTLSEFETYIEGHDEMELRETSVEQFFLGLSTFPGIEDHLLTPFEGTEEESRTLSRLSSNLVSRYLNAGDEENPEFVHLEQDEDENYQLFVDRKFQEQVWILKQLTFYYVIKNSSLAGQQRGQKKLIEDLFDALYEEASREDLGESAIPYPYREWLQEGVGSDQKWPSPIHLKARVVADMIATMTEPQAVTLHKRLTGDTPGSLQNEIVR